MILLTFDLTTGAAKITQAATIRQGAVVPVRVVFSATPGNVSAIQFALGKDSTAVGDKVLAYTEAFTADNDTTWTALLDTNDNRLNTHMGSQGPTSVLVELVVFLDGSRQSSPNLSVTVQPPIIPIDGAATDTGPSYYTAAQIDTLLAGYVPRTVAGKYRITLAGNVELWNATQGKWQAVAATGATGAETLSFAIDNT